MASPEPVVRLADGGSGEPPGTGAAGSHFRLPMNPASTSMASLLGLLASPDQGPAIHSTSNNLGCRRQLVTGDARRALNALAAKATELAATPG